MKNNSNLHHAKKAKCNSGKGGKMERNLDFAQESIQFLKRDEKKLLKYLVIQNNIYIFAA